MSWRTIFRELLAPFRTFDFWLLGGALVATGFGLQALRSFTLQLGFLAAVLAIAVGTSVTRKRLTGWTWAKPGYKGVVKALLLLAFGVYVFWVVVSSHSLNFFPAYEFSTVEGFLRALRHPPTFAVVGPFSCVFLYSAAAVLGLADTGWEIFGSNSSGR